MNCPDRCGGQHSFCPVHKLLQEIDRDVVVRRQVYSDISCQEVVNLALAAVFSTEFLRGHADELLLAAGDLLHLLVIVLHLDN